MEQRKLIHFGKSAFCITLPHTWLKKNKMKKGDTLSVQETLRNSLEISPANGSSGNGAHEELIIDIAEKSTDEIIQLLLSTYLNGYTIITLQGPNAGKVAFIRKHVSEFIAAEVMEVTSNKMVIHIFWDINTISLDSIIRRIGNITKSVFSETIESIDSESNPKDINSKFLDIVEKGHEVQRQVLLARRAIKYALNNSSAAHKFNLSSLELLYVSYIIYFFGMTADYVLKSAEIINKAKLNKFKDLLSDLSAKKELIVLVQRTSDYYSKVFDDYNKHKKLVKFIYSEYADFQDSIEKFKKKNLQLWAPLLAEYLKMLIFKIKETELTMISMENAPK